ncbi:MAG: hypothetical protein JXR76_14500 [Deltaproteobacteria bacterium]|nr:hypothetical protein [Deltaproteobacteria bacterium]
MSLREIMNTEIEQECNVCGATNVIAQSDLAAGTAMDGQVDARVIRLPPCESCGAAEFLIRSAADEPEHPSPGSFGHLHRLLVDVLYSRPMSSQQFAVGIADKDAAGKEVTAGEIEQWFGNGLRLTRAGDGDVIGPLEDESAEAQEEQQ